VGGAGASENWEAMAAAAGKARVVVVGGGVAGSLLAKTMQATLTSSSSTRKPRLRASAPLRFSVSLAPSLSAQTSCLRKCQAALWCLLSRVSERIRPCDSAA